MSRHKVCHESKSNVRQFKASDDAPLHLSAVEVKVVVVVGGLQVAGSWGFTALAVISRRSIPMIYTETFQSIWYINMNENLKQRLYIYRSKPAAAMTFLASG